MERDTPRQPRRVVTPISATNQAPATAIGGVGAAITLALVAAWVGWAATAPGGVEPLGYLAGGLLLLLGVVVTSDLLQHRRARQQQAYLGHPSVELPSTPLQPGARFPARLAVVTRSRVTLKSAEVRLLRWSLVTSHYASASRGEGWEPHVASRADITSGMTVSDSGLWAECQLVLPENAAPATRRLHWRLSLVLDIAECPSPLVAEFPLDILSAPPAATPPPESEGGPRMSV